MPKRAALLLLCAAAATARADRWIPSSARATGANGAVFVTDVRLLNTSETETATVQLVYYPAGKPAFTSVELQIGPRQQKALDNVIETFLGVPGDSSGPIRVVAPDTVQASSRTYNVNDPCSGGTFGTSIPALAPEAALTAGIVAQVAGSADSRSGFRTNLILTNPSDVDTADVEIVLRRGEGGQLGTVGRATIAPHGVFQRELFSLAGASGITTDNAFVEFSSNQPLFAFTTVVDNRTNDSSAYFASPIAGSGNTLVKVGDYATFTGSYGVAGKVTVVSGKGIRLTGFSASSAAPGMDLRVGKSTASRKSFKVLQVLARQSFLDETIELALPSGVDLNAFDTFTVWAYETEVPLAEGKFRGPSGP